MKNKFTEHPHDINETYFEHMRVAFGYCLCFALLTAKSLIHAVFPWMFNGCISSKCCEIADHVRGRIEK